MGPRHEDRGEHDSAIERRHRRASFNGATARRPWRTHVRCSVGGMCYASMGPRHEDRGEPYWYLSMVSHSRGASMGPRHEDRGELLLRLFHSTYSLCFNGATARRPWRTETPRTGPPVRSRFNGATARRPWRTSKSILPLYSHAELQWGHGTKTVENFNPANSIHSGDGASMGPRHEDRGEPPDDLSSELILRWASMGPRHEDRGEQNILQLGPAALSSFNGATARRPWRTRRTAHTRKPLCLASMGPRHEDRGEQLSKTIEVSHV